MNSKEENNLAFIDGQNLYLGTTKNGWKVDLFRFREYLKAKYKTSKAYYFLGVFDDRNHKIYEEIQNSGFILIFKEHQLKFNSKKKGNVDSTIILSIMKKLYYKESFEKIILVSGDGDYKELVDFLIKEKKFKIILFPDKRKASSLYKKLGSEFFDYLEKQMRKIKRAP